jgi:probable Rubsico expression protein CbbX
VITLTDPLEDLVALDAVKERVGEIAALLQVDRLRAEAGLVSARPSLHMCFTGNPGTGKTTVALRMATILFELGYIDAPRMVSVTRDDLVGQFVGHTAPKTREVLKRAAGGVLFIDEAYYLHRPENERDYGVEAIEILLQVMEAERDRLVVILAGYRDRMDAFFASNPGMRSRVVHHLEFPDFTEAELDEIAQRMAAASGYVLGAGASPRIERGANARSVRNALDRARLRHAVRVLDDPDPDLVTLLAEDFA